MRIDLPLLVPEVQDTFRETTFSFDVAPSTQLNNLKLEPKAKKIRISYRQGRGELQTATLGSGDLLLNWAYLRHRDNGVIDAGDIGPVFLKLALDVDALLAEGFDGKRPEAASHFQLSTGKASKHAPHVAAGFRVLSLDLGLRAMAACSVFELRETSLESGLSFAIPDLGLVAVHERSFVLELPEEHVGRRGLTWQEEADAALTRLRRALGRYKRLRSLATVDQAERATGLQELHEASSQVGWPFEVVLLDHLTTHVGAAPAVWSYNVTAITRNWRSEFGTIVSDWRARSRSRATPKYLGKSLWAVEHMTRQRRFLVSWSLLGRAPGDIRRLDREGQGIFAGNLLDHINAMKDDRIKTGADLIVQAARGCRRDTQDNWKQAYDPCQVILFEDLSRYRMRTDRPRRENSQLMLWSHRAIRKETEMQAELYGIFVSDIGAAFSSRYHGATGTPGIRAKPLTRRDLSNAFLLERIAEETPEIEVGALKPGDLVPFFGGGVFCSCGPRNLTRVNADINAAQNLQRRFWTRHGEPFRIVATRVVRDGQEIWVPNRFGERQRGALGGYGYLVPTGHKTGSCRWEACSKPRWSRLAGTALVDLDEDAESELAGFEEEVLERSGQLVIFFRDPSGTVLPTDLWYPAKSFWGITKAKTVDAMKRTH